jgi:hypothetical protein
MGGCYGAWQSQHDEQCCGVCRAASAVGACCSKRIDAHPCRGRQCNDSEDENPTQGQEAKTVVYHGVQARRYLSHGQLDSSLQIAQQNGGLASQCGHGRQKKYYGHSNGRGS